MNHRKPILDQNNLPISGAINEILIKYCGSLAEVEKLNDKTFIERIKRILEREEEEKLASTGLEKMKYHEGVCHGLKIALEQISTKP